MGVGLHDQDPAALAAVGIGLDLRGSIQDGVWPDKTLPDQPCCNWFPARAEQGLGAAEIQDWTRK